MYILNPWTNLTVFSNKSWKIHLFYWGVKHQVKDKEPKFSLNKGNPTLYKPEFSTQIKYILKKTHQKFTKSAIAGNQKKVLLPAKPIEKSFPQTHLEIQREREAEIPSNKKKVSIFF